MFPPLFPLCAASSAVRAIFGDNPRIQPHGVAVQGTGKPYAVFQVISGLPENYLGQLPDIDSYLTQIDVYAPSVEGAADGAQAIRDALEPAAYVTAWRGQFKDTETNLYRYSFDMSWYTPRI